MGVYFAIQVVNWVCNILTLVFAARSILSWIVYSGNQYNSTLRRIYGVLVQITEPIVAPVRRLISRFVRTGPIDLAPMAAFFLVIIARNILIAILGLTI